MADAERTEDELRRDGLSSPPFPMGDMVPRSERDSLAARVEELEGELAAAREALHRCRADMHAKVIALQRERAASPEPCPTGDGGQEDRRPAATHTEGDDA